MGREAALAMRQSLASDLPDGCRVVLEPALRGDGYAIGDVLVVPAGSESPYGRSVLGEERFQLLARFYLGTLPAEWEVWGAPMHGGARRIARDEVRWDTSRIPAAVGGER